MLGEQHKPIIRLALRWEQVVVKKLTLWEQGACLGFIAGRAALGADRHLAQKFCEGSVQYVVSDHRADAARSCSVLDVLVATGWGSRGRGQGEHFLQKPFGDHCPTSSRTQP